ncbi:RNA exonuclease ngl2 [Coemansia interrupta]|uniref:RNA exonuclease ngl2 n=1 Tax=Coemansia interrupta TaxID=1126814 RepID=A0A9W8HM48_9FUNG|nr:RNA exonuclease ngl2 [Coemansia interrupta]
MSYNILCQKLIRRDLFKYASKSSLRMKPRKERVAREIRHLNPDIMCLQEVGTEEWYQTFEPQLKSSGYESRIYQSLRKAHGVSISWKTDRFHIVDTVQLAMDSSLEVCGEKLSTDNVALITVLRMVPGPRSGTSGDTLPEDNDDSSGVIVSSTHLFWRPTACFERLQQQIALLGALDTMKKKYPGYPVISCGDYNTTPDDAGYDLMTKSRPVSLSEFQFDNLFPRHSENFNKADESSDDSDGSDDKTSKHVGSKSTSTSSGSLVSYANIASIGTDAETDELRRKRRRLEKEAQRAEELLQNDTRRVQTLVETFQKSFQPMRSCYGTYADLDPSYRTTQWDGEPIFTNYTAWKGTLDYIFYTPQCGLEVRQVMSLPTVDSMKPGLPNEVFGSDHVSILARFDFKPANSTLI